MKSSKEWECPYCGTRFRKTRELETLQKIGGGLLISSEPVRCPSCLKQLDPVALWSGNYDVKTIEPKSLQTRIEEYVNKLKDKNYQTRAGAALSIGKIGYEAKVAVPALIAVLKDEDYGVRYSAARALGEVGPGAAVAVPALLEALRDENDVVREKAAQSLGKIGVITRDIVSSLITILLDDKYSAARAAAAKSLGEFDSEAIAAVPSLIETLKDLKDVSISVRLSAASALKRITNKDFGEDPEEWRLWWEESKNRI